MKLSRNVLVGSLAVSGMVLGAIAPAMTAQAATGSGAFDDSGKLVQKDTDVGSLTKDGHELAIAYDSTTTDAADPAVYKTATATSNANVNVISGVLVLDAVPNFGFGSGASGSTVALNPKEKTSGDGVDGNDDGTLQVTDARATDANNTSKGFTLNATLAAFKNADGKTAVTSSDGFELSLAPQSIVDGKGENVTTGATDIQTGKTSMTSDGGKTTATVMSPVAGSYKVGTLKAAFDTAAAANLFIPKDVADNTKASTQSLQSVITWTLDATPVAAPAATPAK